MAPDEQHDEEIEQQNRPAFAHGYRAYKAGCHRVLANPANDQELADFLAGWDAAKADSNDA